jgi:hypothetical protein
MRCTGRAVSSPGRGWTIPGTWARLAQGKLPSKGASMDTMETFSHAVR